MAVGAGITVVDSAPKVSVVPATPAGTPDSPAVAATDSARKRFVLDSTKRAEKAKADTAKRRAALLSRFPEAAASALIGRAVDARNYTVLKDDIRVMIMSPPVTLWREARAKSWKDSNMRPDFGVPYDVVDPIEVWSAWKAAVRERRPVYVIEAAPARAPWPEYKPEAIFDIKRGDISSIKVRKDGVDLDLGNVGQVPALVNVDAHEQQKKPNPGQVVATLPADVFAPRADGTVPRIDVVVGDRTRGGSVTLTVPEKMVRKLWEDFQAYRDAIAVP